MGAPRPLSSRATWLMPILLIAGLAAILPAVYLAGTVNPQGHLSNLPVGLVVERQTATTAPSPAETVATAIAAHAGGPLAITRMTRDELATSMHEDHVAGAVMIPADF